MTDIERVEAPLGLLQQMATVEEAGVLHLKGYKDSEISQLLEISPVQAKRCVQEYLSIVQGQVDNDPDFLDRIGLNTFKAVAELNEISKEAWETVTIASDQGLITARLQALKLALDVSSKKAQLLQLLNAGSKDNSDSYARTQRAESVNQMLSMVIRDIIGNCDVCKERARDILAQAFSLMPNEDAEIVPDDN